MSVVSTVREFFRGKAPKLEQPYPAQRDDSIVSYDSSSVFSAFAGGERYNPDDLVGQKGIGIYAKMLQDEQVKSVTEFKLNAILGRGWTFKYEDGSRLSPDEQKKRISVFNAICKKIRGSFLDAIDGVATGREYGYSVTEKVYGQIDYEGARFTGLNMLLTRDPGSFRFFTDDYGLLTKISQRTNAHADVTIDRAKIIHYVHKPKWDLIYGRSELRAAYRAWYLKDITLKLWALHLERFGSGIPVATRDPASNAQPNAGDMDAFKRVMADFKAHTSIILPPGYSAEVVFPTSTDQFQKALEYHDLAVAKSQLVPNLMGVSHTGQTGAYSQSQTQFEAFFWTTSTDGKRLAECLNEQLFRDLGDQNWGDGDYPYFCFKPLTLDNAIKLLAAFRDMIGAGLAQATEDDERFLRELLELPERDPDSEPLVDPMAERQQTQAEEQAEIDNDLRQQELDQKAKQAKAANSDRYSAPPITVTVHNPAPSPTPAPALTYTPAGTGGAAVVPHGPLRGSTLQAFTRAAMRVNFSVIEQRTDNMAEAAVPTLAQIIAKATLRALGDDASMAQLVDDDQSDVAAIDVPAASRGKLKSEFRDVLLNAWTLGSNMAANELDRARGERTAFSVRRAHFADLRDNAASWFDTQAFRMAGDTSDAVRKIIQGELQNGIKFGRSIPEIRREIWSRLINRGLTTMASVRATEPSEAVLAALADLDLEDVGDVAAYLNTLVRTNTFEALNEARFAEFTDPAVGSFVIALEYAAVLDSSTTEICRELNGRVYRVNSPEWDEIRPPNHFNALPMGTKVYTKHGYRPIEELNVGTLVLTHAGRYRRITETMMHKTWPTEIVLHLAGGKQFACTGDHPILTSRGWVCAGDLTESDEVICTEGPCQECGTWTKRQKYCSKACSGAVSGRRFKASAKVRHCEYCARELPLKGGKKKNKRFCNHSCLASAMRKIPSRNCKGCGEPMVSTWKRPVSRERLFCSQSCYFSSTGETSIERAVREWLAIDHIRAEPQKRFGRYTVDFYLPDFHAAIEVDGDYWHTTLDKPAHVKQRRSDYLTGMGLSLIRLPQSAVESGRFKHIVSEWLRVKASAGCAHREDRAQTVQQAGL